MTVRDGTKLAVTVYLPAGLTLQQSVPALFSFTRYGRENDMNPGLFPNDLFLTQNGYAIVAVDARGSSASFGARSGELTPTEVLDMNDIVNWVVVQDWCDGNVGAYGLSYSGTTAELLAATGNNAVKAVMVGWDDMDIYNSPARPYGAVSERFLLEWTDTNVQIDAGLGAVPVDIDTTGSLLAQAISEHLTTSLYLAMQNAPFRDSIIGEVANGRGEFSYLESSPLYWKSQIEASNVPMLVFASWLDAGSADGAIKRFMNYNNNQKLILMPDDHGAEFLASPYQVGNMPLPPSISLEDRAQIQLLFFDYYLKGEDNGYEQALPNVLYYNFAEENYLASTVWPPVNSQLSRYYFAPQGKLSPSTPTEATAQDNYLVDYSVTTGVFNRWYTQAGNPILNLHNRTAMDAKMLTYTTDTLTQDMQITGTPVISLQLSSNLSQGLVLVYLEDVDENGQSRYITEGGLLLQHRKLVNNPDFPQTEPFHSFFATDALPMPINQTEEITFQLLPTSVLIKAGHKIRIAIAGADNGTFARVPATGSPTWKISRNTTHMSYIDLPQICNNNCANDLIFSSSFE